jgi:hypothetical protein
MINFVRYIDYVHRKLFLKYGHLENKERNGKIILTLNCPKKIGHEEVKIMEVTQDRSLCQALMLAGYTVVELTMSYKKTPWSQFTSELFLQAY